MTHRSRAQSPATRQWSPPALREIMQTHPVAPLSPLDQLQSLEEENVEALRASLQEKPSSPGAQEDS